MNAEARLVMALALMGLTVGVLHAAEPTVLTVTDDVLRSDLTRFGIVLGGDSPWGAPIRKERMPHGGFEGIIYRQITFGPGGDERGYWDWYPTGVKRDKDRSWEEVIRGADCWFVTGPAKNVRRRIVEIRHEGYPKRPDKGSMPHYVFDRPGPAPTENDGLFIERIVPDVGYLGQHGGGYWVFHEGGGAVRTVAGDVHPDSRGRVAAELTAPSDGYATLLAPGISGGSAETKGTWHLRFWAKGEGTLEAFIGPWVKRARQGYAHQPVELTGQWKRYHLTFEAQSKENLSVGFDLTGGKVLLDELSFIRDGDTNPTPFTDALVDVLKKLNPGTIRAIHMSGGTIDNIIEPRESRMAYSYFRGDAIPDGTWPAHPNTRGAAKIYSHGLHEFLQLCEHVGADPWYCIPGTLRPEEMKAFIEYIAGPADSPYGARRAARGRKEPWIDAFRRFHVEMGNEAWNGASAYLHAGFSGKGEYWDDLFQAARSSPYFSDRFVLQAAGQASYVGRNEKIARETPSADSFALAPYVIHQMSKAQAAMDDEELFSWVFGYPWYHARMGYMAGNYRDVTKKSGQELSIYEVNHHITGGDGAREPRNRIVAGLGGSVNIANWMWMMLRDHNVRVQNFFALYQREYRGVRLWGSALPGAPGQVRYRPTFLATMLANRVLSGDLVEVKASGDNPSWTCTARYEKSQKTDMEIPYLHAYATRDGAQRGLVLLNLHRTDPLPVRLRLPGAIQAASAVMWRLEADRIDANNESEHGVQVDVQESHPKDLAGATLEVAPFSMTVLRWKQR
jgi:alpha-L-arabinofuranosidase